MEIMRRGRVILERRSLPYLSSTSVGVASLANPRPRLPRRASSTIRLAPFAHPTCPRTARPSWPTAPVRPRASPTARPFTPTPLQSIDPLRPTYSPSCGRGGRLANVPYANPAFREASQAARQAHSVNDRSGRDAPSSSQRRVRLPSEDFDSDDQPLAQRLRCRAPDPSQDSGPSTIPPLPPVTNPTPVPSQADASPALPKVQVEPPLAQPFTSQQHQSTKAGPSHRPSPTTSPPEPSPVPPSAPSGLAAGPSGSVAGPSQPPPPVPLYYRTTAPSEAGLHSLQDVPTSSLTMKGCLATLWEESMHQMELLSPHAQMDRFSELYIKVLRDMVTELELQLTNPTQASHALRAEIKDLTKRKNHLEVSLAHTNHKLKDLQEEKSQVDVVHQQRMDQQALEHQRAIDQLPRS
ncbi:leucine-rich repeat extensin-like protein 5 [Zingiber officinale]|uniref:leucine-rich repeat extensin-like protein 5 n=1 Tax=Zingiber officinale TaxID=94328 RepID=UPI001C4D8E3A|nr:leucine-rich repeat extensin-like protein 5 [Zingiber officinale]